MLPARMWPNASEFQAQAIWWSIGRFLIGMIDKKIYTSKSCSLSGLSLQISLTNPMTLVPIGFFLDQSQIPSFELFFNKFASLSYKLARIGDDAALSGKGCHSELSWCIRTPEYHVAMTLFTKRYTMKKCSDYSLSDYPDWIAGQHATFPSKLLQRAAHLPLKPASSCHATVRQSAYSPWTAWNPTSCERMTCTFSVVHSDCINWCSFWKTGHKVVPFTVYTYSYEHWLFRASQPLSHWAPAHHVPASGTSEVRLWEETAIPQTCAAIRLPSQGVCLVPIYNTPLSMCIQHHTTSM